MSKVRNFIEITPNLPFSEFSFYELYRETFDKSELGRMKKILPLHEMAESFGLLRKRMAPKRGRKSYFTPEGKVALMFLKMKTQMSFFFFFENSANFGSIMEVTNLLDIHTREELYAWYLEHHATARDFWLRVNRASADCPGVVRYVDAVEVALCFGWIDSTMKRIDEGKAVQHFTPRRKGSNWCEQNLARCRRLVHTGEMTPAGLAVAPSLDPSAFVFEDWVMDALRADAQAWEFFQSCPDNYRRIKVDRIQHYQHTNRPEYAFRTLTKFIQDCHNGRMQGGWSDFGRLGE